MLPPTDTPGAPTVLEQGQPLSRSVLWTLQRQFFERWGVAAWGQGHVPHYITSNPCIARSYARVVLAWLRDVADRLDTGEPVHLIELGAGSGRFAFHFLQHFLPAWRASTLRDLPVRYVLTDFTEQNLAFWRGHPALRPFVAAGCLDFATFDPGQDRELHLRVSGDVLAPGGVNPVAVLANYVFDSIPADAFTVRGGQLHECLVSVSCPGPAPEPGEPDLFARLELTFEHRPAEADYYDDPDANAVLRGYAERLDDTCVLFPTAARRCLDHLAELGGGRLLLLSGDKGPTAEAALLGQEEPRLTAHGSFSLAVNYHALAEVVRHRGGQALLPPSRPVSLAVTAFLLGGEADDWAETRQAYAENVGQANPDDFFALKKGIEKLFDSLSIEQLLAYLRLSGYDANILQRCSEALLAQLPAADEPLRQEVVRAVGAVWAGYYHIGERNDLPFILARLLMAAGCYPEALDFFGHSLELYGPAASTFFNMALCQHHLRRLDEAARLVGQALELEPTLGPARSLRLLIEADAARAADCRPAKAGLVPHPGRNGLAVAS
jgi:tetratricopeptide (TPR) repeat protein